MVSSRERGQVRQHVLPACVAVLVCCSRFSRSGFLFLLASCLLASLRRLSVVLVLRMDQDGPPPAPEPPPPPPLFDNDEA